MVLSVSRTTIVIVFILLFDTIYTIHQTDKLKYCDAQQEF